MKYNQIKDLLDEQFRRLAEVKRKTFERMLEILKTGSPKHVMLVALSYNRK